MESAVNWHAVIPELVLACLGMAALMLGVFMRRGATLAVSMFALASLLLVAVLVLSAEAPVVAFHGLFVLDAFAVFTKVLVLLAAALALVLALDWNEKEGIDRFEYPVLVMLATVGMMMMVSANRRSSVSCLLVSSFPV